MIHYQIQTLNPKSQRIRVKIEKQEMEKRGNKESRSRNTHKYSLVGSELFRISWSIWVYLADLKDRNQSGWKSRHKNYSSITIQNPAKLDRAQPQLRHLRFTHSRDHLRTENSTPQMAQHHSVNDDIMKLAKLILVGVNRLDPGESYTDTHLN